jgi:membrane protein involved in colicin uptake|tara:strand:+ start:139 stop:1044 length:906 start_codon:yes stop_codon:yes gene_type:complete
MATVALVKGQIMSEQEIMAEEMQSPKKVAFANRKYTNEERLKKEEEELEQLLAEQKNEEEQVEEPKEEEPTNAEERSFKKRYGDLRRHQQSKEKEYEDRINALQQQLTDSTKSEIKLPKSDEDIEAWAKQYPDVAGIVETIAIKKAREQSEGLEARVKEIDEMKATATREKAEVELLKLHPDFGEIRDSDDFHNWAEEQPKWVQEALYENDEDARSAARAIDLYKADKNIKPKKSASSKDAARSVGTRNERSKPQSDPMGNAIRESDVQKMSAVQYEKNSDEIMEAIRTGNFIYDLSGSAR